MTAHDLSERMAAICARAPVIPVLVIEDARDAAPLARALVAGGLPVIEVTLRTPAALQAIRAMAGVEGAVVGAGTLLGGADVAAAQAAGAMFGVSPGATDGLLDAGIAAGMPLLCGTATPSEAMRLLERGFGVAKFFPAVANGGPGVLKAWAGPLPQMRFCPTGGIGAANAGDWLALPNVMCVGGSWVAPRQAVAAGDWDGITRLAREAAALRRD
ncbi:MAG: bifunctional 4-hydroxy-2-oxoglutarate aldolase/2-dehydro-3-deoxy-phosphogluconate aldolase [Rubellimicrobium sp.]|nr:bifunctional 4-hydroxy-2-oxoglutarate aldolase/2-dehydro-3-deoxy-phosphogluconate aldolase [Rubellimicrobium sp.]